MRTPTAESARLMSGRCSRGIPGTKPAPPLCPVRHRRARAQHSPARARRGRAPVGSSRPASSRGPSGRRACPHPAIVHPRLRRRGWRAVPGSLRVRSNRSTKAKRQAHHPHRKKPNQPGVTHERRSFPRIENGTPESHRFEGAEFCLLIQACRREYPCMSLWRDSLHQFGKHP